MKLQGYKFKIGDEVVTTEGVKGKIVRICNCIECHRRGFYEPIWVADDDKYNEEQCISDTQAMLGFREYYKIGKYRFNSFNKSILLDEIKIYESKINRIKKQLTVIEEYENKEE